MKKTELLKMIREELSSVSKKKTHLHEASVAKIILSQLGGMKFVRMTGAKNIIDGGASKYLSFKLPKAKDGINFVKISLTSSDTYNIEFGRIHAMKYTIKKNLTDIYADQLQEVFTKYTGLYTSL